MPYLLHRWRQQSVLREPPKLLKLMFQVSLFWMQMYHTHEVGPSSLVSFPVSGQKGKLKNNLRSGHTHGSIFWVFPISNSGKHRALSNQQGFLGGFPFGTCCVTSAASLAASTPQCYPWGHVGPEPLLRSLVWGQTPASPAGVGWGNGTKQ